MGETRGWITAFTFFKILILERKRDLLPKGFFVPYNSKANVIMWFDR